MNDIAVIILTYNEELHIERALRSIASIAREIVIVDSYSTDRTLEICRAAGARVVQNPFVNQAKQFQWSLDNVPVTSEWIIRLDADEIIEPDLAKEIAEKLPQLRSDVAGINLHRKTIFLNRWIKHGGRYPLTMLRIWRRGKGRIEDRWMDEHIYLTEGRAVTFDGGFADHNLNDLTFFTDKHNKYATREAIEVINQRRGLFLFKNDGGTRTTSRQASSKRFLKENLYNKVPFEIGALSYFLYRYFLRFGFLDGREGLIYHFLQGFWYRFLVGAKVRELETALGDLQGESAAKELSRITGLRLVE